MHIWIIWIDEAGRWAWAWPVVAAAVFWWWRCPIHAVLRDSKKMSPSEREKTYHHILDLSDKKKLIYAVGIISNEDIDTFGIREANRLAMQLALQKMNNDEWIINNEGITLVIDWRDNYQFDTPNLPKPEYIVRGDSKIKQIMAASIVAKVTRDNIMKGYEKELPWYGFAQHKGYGTAWHQKKLQELGVCKIHRKSYAPIRILIQK